MAYQVNTVCPECGRRYSYRSDTPLDERKCPHPHVGDKVLPPPPDVTDLRAWSQGKLW